MCLRWVDSFKQNMILTEWKDIGIATFLMLLWKQMYHKKDKETSQESLAEEPWKTWPRPPAGFLDLG